jgi:dihydrofolate reductase
VFDVQVEQHTDTQGETDVLDRAVHVDVARRLRRRPQRDLGRQSARRRRRSLARWFPAGVVPGDESSRRPSDGINSRIFDELNATGAIVAGAGTFEPADGWGGDHHGGVPIFIYSRHDPRIDISGWPLVTYVDDVDTAMADAKQAAGDKNVSVHGAAVAQLALTAGVLDELELHVVPVLLGDGRRLFEGLGPGQVELERIRVLQGEHGVTHLRYRVTHSR